MVGLHWRVTAAHSGAVQQWLSRQQKVSLRGMPLLCHVYMKRQWIPSHNWYYWHPELVAVSISSFGMSGMIHTWSYTIVAQRSPPVNLIFVFWTELRFRPLICNIDIKDNLRYSWVSLWSWERFWKFTCQRNMPRPWGMDHGCTPLTTYLRIRVGQR